MGDRQIGSELLGHGDGSRPGTAAAVRAAEGLVRVEVHQVGAEIAGPGNAQDGVHVGPVEIDQAAHGVDHLGDLGDVRFEDPQRVGIGDHEHGHAIVEPAAKIVEIDQARRRCSSPARCRSRPSRRWPDWCRGRRRESARPTSGCVDRGSRPPPPAGPSTRLGPRPPVAAKRPADRRSRPASAATGRAVPACPGSCRRSDRDADWRSPACRRSVRSAWDCTSSYTSPRDRNAYRPTCSVSTG